MNNIIRKISWRCNPNDAVWTGSTHGTGIITYNPDTGKVTFRKVRGCNPYWYQVAIATLKMVPATEYIRENRRYPFNVTKTEGMSGAMHLHLNVYKKLDSEYYMCSQSVHWDISANGKTEDFDIWFGDLIEFLRFMYEKIVDRPFSRNPNDYLQGNWRFEKLRGYELATEDELYIPSPKKDEEDE